MFRHLAVFFTRKQTLAIGFAFFSIGFLFGSWATFIPIVKQKFNLDDAQLGLLLLSMPIGSLTANPIAAALLQRIGMQKMTVAGILFLATAFSLPLHMPNLVTTSLSLISCGMGITLLNVAMNTCASALELAAGITIMSTCHGMFSLGLMVGSLLSSSAGGLMSNPIWLLTCFGGLIWVGGAFVVRKTILQMPDDPTRAEESSDGAKFIWPTGPLLIMILISVFINFSEGSMADWTAVYMKEVVEASPYFIGWGLSGYSLFMALGRFMGDSLIPRIGQNKILVYGGALSAFGLALAIIFPYTWTTIAGFACVGAGVSCGAPIMYGSAARIPGLAKGAGLATMNTFAMGGFLFGPVLIGFISEATSLPIALGVIATMGIAWAWLSRTVKLY